MALDILQEWCAGEGVKHSYSDFCKAAATDDSIFNTFKQSEIYRTILEHVSPELGMEYLNYILTSYSNDLLQQIIGLVPQFKENDRFGSPHKATYPIFGETSPTNLRYVKTLMDLVTHGFDLNGKDVIEIGAGYGGQCLVLHKFFPNIKSYTILDLENVSLLQGRYLKENGLNVTTSFLGAIPDRDYDFVMSNYAFSELTKELEDEYITRVIDHSKSGYFQMNPGTVQGYNKEDLIARMSHLKDMKIHPDLPLAKYFVEDFILTFGL